MLVRQVKHGDEDYQRTLDMRFDILRAPLGLGWSAEDLAAEGGQWHFGLFDDDDALVACVVIKPLGDGLAKLRQMAVAEGQRGQGRGRELVAGVEDALRDKGVTRIQMDARKIARGFYEKLGYTVEGDEFIQVTIPHFRMVKSL